MYNRSVFAMNEYHDLVDNRESQRTRLETLLTTNQSTPCLQQSVLMCYMLQGHVLAAM
jgi:hypothetical protein